MSEKIKLKVAEALKNDVGRGLIRIGSKPRQKLNLTSGDIVKIKGKKNTAAKVWQSHPQDERKGIARIDGVIRQNAGVSIGDKIELKKIKPKQAEKIVLAPTQKIRFSPGFKEHVKKQLSGTPISQGDKIVVGVFGTSLLMIAKSVKPSGIVQVTSQTGVEVREKPVQEMKGLPHVTYEDIGGLDEEIQKIREMVEIPMKHPEIFERLGIDPPKGVLLHGPPGTGKTLMAKAVANESDANFIHIQGPEVMSKFVGEAEKKIRKIFEQAQEDSPTIIFIDEIDAIAPKREEATGEVERRVVSQILASMDGLEARGEVVVIAATNRVNAIDPALRRPGRFDREIEIGVPDRKARKEIFQIHTRNMPISDDVDLNRFSDRTHGFVGADLESLAKESAMKALRRLLPKVDLEKEEGIPQELIDDLKVNKEDFDEAMKEIQPSAMREVFVQVPKVTWDDVGGLEEPKQRLVEAVDWPLKKPEKFKKLGIDPPAGILLFGPPGTGKTLLAKAVANESEYNFIAVKGPELLSKWVGESEKAVREVFRKARQAAPVVVFFDELDSLAPRRGRSSGSHVTESVVNQILSELDGLEDMKDVVVIGSSNRPELIDPALLRPGRFDEMVVVPAPDEESRKKIFEVHTRNVPLDSDVNTEELARETKGYSGADIEGIVQEAAMEALRNDEEIVTKDYFKGAISKISPSITDAELSRYKEFMEEYGKEKADATSYID